MGENIFNTCIEKELVNRTYKELLQIDKKRTNYPIKMGQRLEQTG